MATVTFSAAGETLYAYLAGEIDHDAAQSLRMQLDDALVSRSPAHLDYRSWRGGVHGFLRHRTYSGAAALRPDVLGTQPARRSTPPRSCKKSCGWRASPVPRRT